MGPSTMEQVVLQLWPHEINAGNPFPGLQRDITLVIGDSIANGFGSTITPADPGALENWDGTAFVPITNQSVANGQPTKGSIWQKYATDYYNESGTTVYLVNAASPGSDVCPVVDNNDWSTTGTLYAAMKAKVDAAVADAEGSYVTTICIHLMINDVRLNVANAGVSPTIATITTHWNSLLDRLHADFPNAQILLINIGRIESVAFNEILIDTRDLIVDTTWDREYCHMITSLASYVGVSGAYLGDLLHPSQATNDAIGVNFAKWRRYSTGLTKHARSIVAAHHSDIDVTFRNKIQALVTSLGDDLRRMPYLTPLYSDDVRNYLVDFTFRSYSVAGSGGFLQSANGWMDTNNAVANCLAAGYYTGLSKAGGSNGSNFNFFVRVGAIRTAPGSIGTLFGRVTGANRVLLIQPTGASDVFFTANDNTVTAVTDDDLLPDVLHTVGRNAGNKHYYNGNTLRSSAAVAKVGDINDAIWVGCRSLDGVLDNPIDADLGFVGAFPDSVDRANLVAAIEEYLSEDSGVPDDALLAEDGTPILDENGNYITT